MMILIVRIDDPGRGGQRSPTSISVASCKRPYQRQVSPRNGWRPWMCPKVWYENIEQHG